MADDKLKTGSESPGPDRSDDVPVEDAPPLQEFQAQETSAPEKEQGPAELGMGPASQPDQSVIPEIEADDPAHFAPGEVVVDFDKINELMSQRRAAADAARRLLCGTERHLQRVRRHRPAKGRKRAELGL